MSPISAFVIIQFISLIIKTVLVSYKEYDKLIISVLLYLSIFSEFIDIIRINNF